MSCLFFPWGPMLLSWFITGAAATDQGQHHSADFGQSGYAWHRPIFDLLDVGTAAVVFPDPEVRAKQSNTGEGGTRHSKGASIGAAGQDGTMNNNLRTTTHPLLAPRVTLTQPTNDHHVRIVERVQVAGTSQAVVRTPKMGAGQSVAEGTGHKKERRNGPERHPVSILCGVDGAEDRPRFLNMFLQEMEKTMERGKRMSRAEYDAWRLGRPTKWREEVYPKTDWEQATADTMTSRLQALWGFQQEELEYHLRDVEALTPIRGSTRNAEQDNQPVTAEVVAKILKERWEATQRGENRKYDLCAELPKYLVEVELSPTKGPRTHGHALTEMDKVLEEFHFSVMMEWRGPKQQVGEGHEEDRQRRRSKGNGGMGTNMCKRIVVLINAVRVRLQVMNMLAKVATGEKTEMGQVRGRMKRWQRYLQLRKKQHASAEDGQIWGALKKHLHAHKVHRGYGDGGWIYGLSHESTRRQYIGVTMIGGSLRGRKHREADDGENKNWVTPLDRYIQHLTAGWRGSTSHEAVESEKILPFYKKARALRHGLSTLIFEAHFAVQQGQEWNGGVRSDRESGGAAQKWRRILTARDMYTTEKLWQRLLRPGYVNPWVHDAHRHGGRREVLTVLWRTPEASQVNGGNTANVEVEHQNQADSNGSLLWDTKTEESWTGQKNHMARYQTGRIRLQEDQWDINQQVHLIMQCQHQKAATRCYHVLRRLDDNKCRELMDVASWLGGSMLEMKMGKHIRRAHHSRIKNVNFRKENVTLLPTKSGLHQSTFRRVLEGFRPLLQEHGMKIRATTGRQRTLNKVLENAKQLQRGKWHGDVVCTCQQLEEACGEHVQASGNGHKWVTFLEAIGGGKEGTVFAKIREDFGNRVDMRDLTVRVPVVEKIEKAANHMGSQVMDIMKRIMWQRGKRRPTETWSRAAKVLGRTIEKMMREEKTEEKAIEISANMVYLRRTYVISTLDKGNWDMRVACPMAMKDEVWGTLRETHEELSPEETQGDFEHPMTCTQATDDVRHSQDDGDHQQVETRRESHQMERKAPQRDTECQRAKKVKKVPAKHKEVREKPQTEGKVVGERLLRTQSGKRAPDTRQTPGPEATVTQHLKGRAATDKELFLDTATTDARLGWHQRNFAQVLPKYKDPGRKFRLIVGYDRHPNRETYALGASALTVISRMAMAKQKKSCKGVASIQDFGRKLRQLNKMMADMERDGFIVLTKCDFEMFFLKVDRTQMLQSTRYWIRMVTTMFPRKTAFAGATKTQLQTIRFLYPGIFLGMKEEDLAKGRIKNRCQLQPGPRNPPPEQGWKSMWLADIPELIKDDFLTECQCMGAAWRQQGGVGIGSPWGTAACDSWATFQEEVHTPLEEWAARAREGDTEERSCWSTGRGSSIAVKHQTARWVDDRWTAMVGGACPAFGRLFWAQSIAYMGFGPMTAGVICQLMNKLWNYFLHIQTPMESWLGKSQTWLQKVAEYHGGGKCMKQTFEDDAASVVGMTVAMLNVSTGHIWGFSSEGWQGAGRDKRLVTRLERKTAKDKKGNVYKAPVGIPKALDNRNPQLRDAPFLTFVHRALDIAMSVYEEAEQSKQESKGRPQGSGGMFGERHIRWICEPVVEVFREAHRAGHTRHDVMRVIHKARAMQRNRRGAGHREVCLREVQDNMVRWWKTQ